MLRTCIKVAGGALAAVLAVAACGSVRMGAAAITSQQRLSSATLAAQVAHLNAAYRVDRKKIQISYTPAQMPRLVLTWLLRFQIRDEQARRAGLTVTSGAAQRALSQLTRALKQQSPAATLAQVAVANGIPPDLLPDLGRYQAVQTALASRLAGGRPPRSASAQQAVQARFDRDQCLAAKSLDIQVNPQYGELDYSQLSVVAAPATLSRLSSPLPRPSVTPQLRPPC